MSELIQNLSMPVDISGKQKGVTRSWLWLNLLLVVLIFLIVGAGIGFYYSKMQQLTQTIDRLQTQTERVQQAYAIEEAGLNTLQKTISDQGFQLQQQNQRIKRLALFSQQRQWRLDEIRYLINLSNMSLLFAHDVKTSDQLLLQVQNRIAVLYDARLNTLDQAVKSDREMLAELKIQDVIEVFSQLTAINQRVDLMPLLGSSFVKEDALPKTAVSVANTWQERLQQTLHQLKFFLVIRKTSNPLLPLIAQEQGDYIKQYVHLQLGQAQWAALRHDNVVYQDSLKQANFWIGRYFIAQDPNTQSVLHDLDALQAVAVDFPLINLDKTVNALSALTNN